MDALSIIGEQRILEAVRRGDLDDLPTRGTPVPIEDLSSVSPELRLSYLVLRTTGYVPEEVAARREMLSLRDLMNLCEDDEEYRRARSKWNAARIRWEQHVAERGGSAAVADYRVRMDARFEKD